MPLSGCVRDCKSVYVLPQRFLYIYNIFVSIYMYIYELQHRSSFLLWLLLLLLSIKIIIICDFCWLFCNIEGGVFFIIIMYAVVLQM